MASCMLFSARHQLTRFAGRSSGRKIFTVGMRSMNALFASVARAVKLKVPLVGLLPEKVPLLNRLMPGGGCPASSAKLTGATPVGNKRLLVIGWLIANSPRPIENGPD